MPTLSGHDLGMIRPGISSVTTDTGGFPGRRFVKSAGDRCIAAVLIVVLLPSLLVIGLLIALDGGPVLFLHRRIGRDGQTFDCLKFRTMCSDAEALLQKTFAENSTAAIEWATNRKLRRDPRVTRIGRVLRATSLDELPQLINVIRGEMSLVGPRPIVRDEITRYGRDIEFYLRVKPGITGLWQISGRSFTSYPERVRLDVWYVQNWSLRFDLFILFRTIGVLIRRQGSY